MNEKIDLKIRIIETAKELFARYGYGKVSTLEIANLLGISKRTLYDNFKSKEALFTAVIDETLGKSKEKIDSFRGNLSGESAISFFKWIDHLWEIHLDIVSVFTKEFLTDIEKVSPANLKKIENFRNEQFRDNFEYIYSFGAQNDLLKTELNKDVVFMIYLFVFGNILKPEVLSSLPLPLNEIIQTITEIMLTGTMTEKGRNSLKNASNMKNNNTSTV